MRWIGVILWCFQSVFALTFYSTPQGNWSLDRINQANVMPGPDDNLIVLHNMVMDDVYHLNAGSIRVQSPAVLVFTNQVFFSDLSSVFIAEGAQITFMDDLYTYSMDFENHGIVEFYQFIYNHGYIKSWGSFMNGSNGRKLYNYGRFNNVIGGEGPHAHQAYKVDDINLTVPFDGDDLPVVWGDITADQIGDELTVSWEVFSELNNDFFYIVASQDMYHWDTLGSVDGRGTAAGALVYDFSKEVFQNYEYVGVGQTDFDGSSELGGIVTLKTEAELKLTRENEFYILNKKGSLEVYNSLGQKVKVNVEYENERIKFNVVNLETGVYLASFDKGDMHQVFKFYKD